MNRIKKIIEALKVLSRTPSKTIAASWALVKHSNAGSTTSHDEAITLIDNIIKAVVDIAEDMEAKDASEALAIMRG